MSNDLPVYIVNSSGTEKLARIIADLTPYIEGKIASMSISGYDRDDLRQEAMIALLSAADNYREEGGASFRTYAVSCINNRLTDAARRASGQGNRTLNESEQLDGRIDEADVSPLPEEMASLREELGRVMADIRDKLSAFECRVMTLWLRGYAVREIAAMTARDPRSVSNALDRARRKLKDGSEG